MSPAPSRGPSTASSGSLHPPDRLPPRSEGEPSGHVIRPRSEDANGGKLGRLFKLDFNQLLNSFELTSASNRSIEKFLINLKYSSVGFSIFHARRKPVKRHIFPGFVFESGGS